MAFRRFWGWVSYYNYTPVAACWTETLTAKWGEAVVVTFGGYKPARPRHSQTGKRQSKQISTCCLSVIDRQNSWRLSQDTCMQERLARIVLRGGAGYRRLIRRSRGMVCWEGCVPPLRKIRCFLCEMLRFCACLYVDYKFYTPDGGTFIFVLSCGCALFAFGEN